MPSVAVSSYREFLRNNGQVDKADNYSDGDLALELKQQIEQRGWNIEEFAAGRGDTELVPLIKEAYGANKTYSGILDAPAQQYYTKKQGFKQGAAAGLGAVGMDETERDLMRSAQRDARKGARAGREIFDDYTMIDSFEDLLKYVGQGSTRSIVDIVPSMVSAVAGRGVGSKIQKTLEKTDKLSDLKKKAEKYLGEDYGAKAGMGAGALGSSALENTGHVYGDLYEYTKLDPTDKDYLSPAEARALSMFAGGVSGALDSALPVFLLGKLSKSIGKDAAQQEVGKLFKSLPDGMVFLAQGAGGEGITEALQEVVQMATVKYHTGEEWNEKDWERMVNGGLLGAIGGGTVTAATGGVARLLQPGQPTEDGEISDAPLEQSTEERLEIRNRFEEKKLNKLAEEGLGTLVTQRGSKRSARVLSVDNKAKVAVVEYANGNTEKIKVTELTVLEGKSKLIKPEDLKAMSDERLEDLKALKPAMVKEILAEQESRKEEVDDDTIQTQTTQLEVKATKDGQLIVNDLSSRERVYSATFREEDGVLYIENEAIDAPTDQRKQQSQDILYRQARKKAQDEGLILSLGGNIEFPVPSFDAMDMGDMYTEFAKAIQIISSLEDGSNAQGAVVDAYRPLMQKMHDDGLLESDGGASHRMLDNVETKKNNSAFLKNNPVLARTLAYKIFTDIEGEIENYGNTLSQEQINEKRVIKDAKALADLYVEEIDGLSTADALTLARAATRKFAEQHLKDDQWKTETNFDIQTREDEKKAEENKRLQTAKDNFDEHEPEVGKFVRLDKDDKSKYVRITSVDPDTNSFKTEETGDNSVSASAIIKIDTRRALRIADFNAIQKKDGSITTKLTVYGRDTESKKGRQGVELSVTEDGKVTHVKYGEKTIAIDEDKNLTLESDNLKSEIGNLVLEEKTVKPEKTKTILLAPGISKKGDVITTKPHRIKNSNSRKRIKVTPDVTVDGMVVGFTEGEEVSAFDKPVQPSEWVEAARSKLAGEGRFVTTPTLTNEEQKAKDEAEANPSNVLSFFTRQKKKLIPSTEIIEIPEGGIKDFDTANNFINSIDLGSSGSSTSKKALVLRYFKEGETENPVYLVRTITAPTDADGNKGRTIVGMTTHASGKNKSKRKITPLSSTKGGLDLTDENFQEHFDDDTDLARLEIVELLSFSEEARVEANFESEEAYKQAIEQTTDYEFIRSKTTKEVQDFVKQGSDRAKRIESLVMDGDKFNPLLNIYGPSLNSKVLDKLKKDIKDRASKSSDKDIKELGKSISKSEQIRIVDLDAFVTHIQVGDKGEVTHGLDVLSPEGEYGQVKQALINYRTKDGKVQKSESKKKADGELGASSIDETGFEILDETLNPLEELEKKDEEETPEVEEEVEEEPWHDPMDLQKDGRVFYPNGDRAESPVHKVNINGKDTYVTSVIEMDGSKTWYRYGDKDGNNGKVYAPASDYPVQAGSKKELIQELEKEEAPVEESEEAPNKPIEPTETTEPEQTSTLSEEEREIVEAMVRAITDANLSKSEFGEANLAIKNFEDGEVDIGNTYSKVTTIIENAQLRPQNESVGEIAHTEADLEREIQKHIDEPKNPRLKKNPLSQELQQENEQAVTGFLDGMKVDGEPVRLSALINRMIQGMDGSTELSGAILDMAQTLLAHPFAKKLKVEFRSWDNFKHGIQNDGNNGKLTRAYVRGDTIVMGPSFKLQADSDLNAMESLQITFMEEVAHRVLGTAVEAGIQAKRKGKLPRGVAKVMSLKQAIKFYDETKELMDWLRTKTDGKYYHGLLNQHEFWANFATNPEFRKFLNQPMPQQMRRKFNSRFERVIDWILDLASKLFDVDFTLNRTASAEIRKRYRTVLRTSDKMAANDIDLMPQRQMESNVGLDEDIEEGEVQDEQMESADTFDTDDSASVAQGTLRAHMASLKDFGSVVKGALADLGEGLAMTPERMKEFITIEGKTTPDILAKILGKKAKVLVEEAQQQLAEATSPDIKALVDTAENINDLETRANKDTGARNLYNLLTGAKESVQKLYSEIKHSKDTAQTSIVEKKARMEAMTKPKSMFDAQKTQAIFTSYFKKALFNKTEKGEYSNAQAFEVSMGLKPTPITLLRELNEKTFTDGVKISEQQLYNLMDRLAEAQDAKDFLELKTAKEIFDLMDIKAEDVGIKNPDLDQAVQAAIALMLGSDQKNDVPRSAFTVRMRLAPGRIAGTSVEEAVQLIKAASMGRPTPDVKDKSMMSILKNVRKLREEIDSIEDDLKKTLEEEKVAEKFIEAYNDRLDDLDEYFDSTAPVEIHEGAKYEILRMDGSGKMISEMLTFSLGKGESSNEAKMMAARASELFKIMDTQEYKDQYEGKAKDRYFKQLAKELRKPNFGIQYTASHTGFLHAAASSLQERFARLGPPGKAIATVLNEYTRDYQSEAGKIFGQGRKVSQAMQRLHREMSASHENLNQFMKGFGSKLFDWFNERPDLQGQEELAINKVWKELKELDPTREYTEDGRKALRAYLKQWSIQNENFKRLYKKYDISVLDEDVARERLAGGTPDALYRRFVDQGVFTTPRRLNMDKIGAVVQLLKVDVASNFEMESSLFEEIFEGMGEAEQEGSDTIESFTQSMGKLIDTELSNLFFKPLFMGKSAHTTPFSLTADKDEGKSVRILLPEELERAWRNAEGKNPGIRVANAILNLTKNLPDADQTTLKSLLGQFAHRANALISAEQEARDELTDISEEVSGLTTMMQGSKMHSSIHSRTLYNILPGEFFEYEMYDETSSGQYLSKIMMTAKFGRNGEKITGNYQAILDNYSGSYRKYRAYMGELGIQPREGAMPSRGNKIWSNSVKKKMTALMASKGESMSFDQLDLESRNYIDAKNAMAAASAAFTARSSNNQDIGLGLEVLRTLAFGMVNTMKGAWTGTMSIPDIGKALGLNATMLRTVGGAYVNLAKEMAGSLLESFGIEMLRADKYASDLNDVFSREAGMSTFSENITEVGKEGSLSGMQLGLRKLKNSVNAISMIGAGQRKKTSGNYVPASLLTPLTAPFTYLAQATNKSIALSMANTIERFVIQAAHALDAKGVTLDNNTFEIKPSDLGYEDSKLDGYIFGNIAMVEKLNERLVSEGMSITQLAQDYRRRTANDPDAKALTRDAVLASYNIAMSEVTYDTMSGKGSWTQSGGGQFLSPLVGWSVSSYSKSINQMRNKEGRVAMRESIRYMLMTSAWLLPAGIAFTLFTDWWDEEILGKPSSLRKVPYTAGLPIIGLPMAMTDPRFDAVSLMERSARANNIMGIAQEFVSPLLIGQLDPSSMAGRFDPTRRVLAISTLMNTVGAATNYLNAIRTSNKEADDFVPDYSTVVRPLMYAMGLNAVVQNAQMATHLTDIEELDPTGFLSTERRVADITGMRNSLRTYSKVMGMEMRKGGFMTYTATAMGNALKRMERAAYANDKEEFKEAYRKAVSLSESEDPRKDVIDKFKRRHLRQGITRYALTDRDLQAILGVLSEGRRGKISSSMRNHDFYLRGIGGKPTESRSDKVNYSEKLRRLAL